MIQLNPRRFKRLAPTTKNVWPITVKSIKQQGDEVVIEGLANAATVDRTDEVIPPSAWDIEEYLENPVILFNHGKDPNYGFLPVGKAIAIKITDQGLWVKVTLSNSDVPKIKAIRDLVIEGILKTFSVGFDPGDERRDANGVNVVGYAKLLEISIVTLPMNKDSTFSLSAKDILAMDKVLSRLRQKGAWVAAAVQQRIYSLQQTHGDFNRDRALEEVGDQAGVRLDDVRNVLTGEVTPVPQEMLAAFAKVLGMDEGKLTQLDKGDREVEKRPATAGGARQEGATLKGASLPPLRPDGPTDWAEVMERAPKTSVDVPPNKKAEPGPDAVAQDDEYEGYGEKEVATQTHRPGDEAEAVDNPSEEVAEPQGKKDDAPLGTGEPETEPGEDSPTTDSEPDVAVQAIVIPKDVVPNLQDATTWVKDHGWIVDNVNQTEDAFYFVQTDPSAFDTDSFYLVDLGEGAWAQVGERESSDPYGTPPIDAQNEAKSAKDGEAAHNADKKPQTQAEAPNAQTAPVPSKKECEEPHNEDHEEQHQGEAPVAQRAPAPAAKDGASGGTSAGPAASASPGDSTIPFAVPQGPGPWTNKKPPPKKKPTISVDPHTGKPRNAKGADPNADTQTGQPVDAEAEQEGKHGEKVKAGTACAECMAKWMKDGLDNGKPHDQAVAIAISECASVCPTQPQEGKSAYSPDQLRAFADGFRTAHEQAKGVGLFKAGTKSATDPARKKDAAPGSPTSEVGATGTGAGAAADPEASELAAIKQTNTLLGALIAEIQNLSKKFDTFLGEEATEPAHQHGQPSPSDMGAHPGMQPGGPQKGVTTSLENLGSYVQDLNLRLKKLGV